MTRRSPSAALMPLDEAVRLITARVAPVKARLAPLDAALGCIAADDVIAPADLPAGPIALRDGWAVAAVDAAGASPFTPVLISEEPGWIEAGAGLPDGIDTVLPPEAVEIKTPNVEIVMDAPTGEGVRGAGADILAGDMLLAAGAPLNALGLLALAAAGLSEIAIRSPRLSIVATGEIRGRACADALTPSLTRLAMARGCEIAQAICDMDAIEAIATAITPVEADAVIVIGGTGFGHTDKSAAALAQAGRLEAHGIALTPGDTAGFGEAGGRPVLLLPGRIEAGLAAFLALGLPLIAALSGSASSSASDQAPLIRKVASTIGFDEIVFVRRVEAGIEPLGGLDIPLVVLGAADGYIVVPADREGYAAGTLVEVRRL